MFFAVFLQINPKPKVASSRRPQGPLTWIVQFDCKTLANTTKFGNSSPDSIWQILQANLQSKSNLERLRQLLFEMAPGDPWIGNFYLKKSLNIFYLSCLKYNWLLVLEKNWSCGKMFLLLTRYHYWSDNIIDIEFWWFHETVGRNSFESHHHTVFFSAGTCTGVLGSRSLENMTNTSKTSISQHFHQQKTPLLRMISQVHGFVASRSMSRINKTFLDFSGESKTQKSPSRFYINGLSCFQWPLGYAPMLAIEHIPQISIQNSIDVFPLP